MSPLTRRLLALCLPPLLAWSVDCILTLRGQSEAYWAGRVAQDTDGVTSLHSYPASVNEVNPTSRYLLASHPLAYIAGTVLEMLILCSLILLLPPSLAVMTCLAATLGHTWGATTWLSRFQYGFQIGNGFFLFVAVILTAGMQVWYARGQLEPLLVQRMPLILRWLLIGVLSVIFVYLGLWPRVR
jgi:hypothetical protein